MPEGDRKAQNSNEEYPFPGLDIIFELTKEQASEQTARVNLLDSKANFILGSATALISTALILQSSLLSQGTRITNRFLELLPLLALLLVYLLVMFAAFFAYRVRVYKRSANPQELQRNYLNKSENTIKAEVFRAMVDSFQQNERTINKKAHWVNIAFAALGCETLILVALLLFQVVY